MILFKVERVTSYGSVDRKNYENTERHLDHSTLGTRINRFLVSCVNTNKPVYWNLTLEFRAKRQTRFDPSKFSSRKTIQVRKRIELTNLYRNTGTVSLMTETYNPSS